MNSVQEKSNEKIEESRCGHVKISWKKNYENLNHTQLTCPVHSKRMPNFPYLLDLSMGYELRLVNIS